GSNHEDRYKFQIYFKDCNHWQYYGLCNGSDVQPVKDFWDGCFHIPSALCSDTAGKPAYMADIVLSLNADGYTHAFSNLQAIPYSDNKLLLDFGNSNHSSSVATSSPDANGNYWNNIQITTNGGTKSGNGLSFSGLLYKNGLTSPYSLVLTSNTQSNGANNGGLTESKYSKTTAQSLGDLGIPTATQDYFYAEGASTVCSFELRGLNPANTYRMRFFGSRAATADNQTRRIKLTVNGTDTYVGELQICGPNNGNQNTENLLMTPQLAPDADGTLEIKFQKGYNSASGSEFYQLNCMDIEEFGTISTLIEYESLSVTSTEETFQMHRAPTGGCVFEGVSTFSEGNVSLTATAGGQNYNFNATCDVNGPAYLVADLYAGTFTFTALPELLAEGNAAKGFSATNGITIPYAGNGIYSITNAEFTGTSGMSPEAPRNEHGKSRFTFVKPSNNYQPQFRRDNTDRGDIRNNAWGSASEIYLNPGTYDVTVNMRNFTFSITPKHNSDHRISVMGSSVPWGSGADNERGYTWFYSTYLPESWTLSNICIPGNNTNDLLNRYDELIADGADYVLYALSLGNEGIHGASNQEAIYNQWKTNMQTLISKARADGKTVAVTGNYARGDFNASDYEWTRKLNLDIHQWDVPSVNLLGTVDEGNGHWADGYQNGTDTYHPNTDGHREMSYSLVPSMFDAMAAGKALPVRNTSGSLALTKPVTFTPENVVHSFTAAFSFKTTASDLNLIETSGDVRSLTLSAGKLTYDTVSSSTFYNDDNWHQVVLTHFYAWGKTLVYIDGALVGSKSEKIVPTAFSIGASGATVREIFFWRSGMNADEISALHEGKMLKSSLEIYAPLAGGSLDNKATSTNTITY
ncbi:MAG: hypothetical protein K5984_04745, partial [Bacteroidales bacterium]|nr:hypothetical protein [Bacteroidales bacterium]